ncbi:MAG: glycerol kinase GlpK [Deltaproteobacteria bacterium]|nr:glycerol kinase GlpK [Deltaproteobacteria bacterium]MBN2846562.1 glycerol kinase GlpK [Deltaproteobacteria bacterium]
MPYMILAIDQGTTGTTVVLFDSQFKVVSRGYQEFCQIYPTPGCVEHNPEDIWKSVLASLDAALTKSGADPSHIRAIGITNQRETTVVWNRETGKPYYNAIVWQCRRTADICEYLKDQCHEDMFRKKTGLLLDPYFSGTKLTWYFRNVPDLREEASKGKVASGTIDAFLVWKLSGGKAHVTDVSNASRTLLMDIESLSWNEDLCSILEVPMNVLPEIKGSTEIFGHTTDVPGIPDGIPICGIAGDQQAALFGQSCFQPGEAKCTYGTGSFLLMNTGSEPVFSNNKLLTTVAWKLNGGTTYALEGSTFIAGAAVQWLRDGLNIIENAADIEELASRVPDTGGVTMVPAFVGLGAPHWRSDARGLISGLTRGTNRAHLARAVLEGIALQNVEILYAMESDSKRKLLRLKVDGGASNNNLLMQMQADLLGCTIVRPEMVEATALGAAFLAGIGAGIIKNTSEITGMGNEYRSFEPEIDDDERKAVLERWHTAVGKA